MRIVNEYVKGGNRGSIIEDIHEGDSKVKIFIAVMASSSKTFKNVKYAEIYMAKLGYKKLD